MVKALVVLQGALSKHDQQTLKCSQYDRAHSHLQKLW